MTANFGGHVTVELCKPARGNGGEAIGSACKHPRQRAGGIGVSTLIDGLNEAIGKGLRAEVVVQHGLHRVDDEGRALARIGLETESFVFCHELAAHLSGFLLAVPVKEAVHHGDKRQAGVIRKRVMMRDARLGKRPGLRLAGSPKVASANGRTRMAAPFPASPPENEPSTVPCTM